MQKAAKSRESIPKGGGGIMFGSPWVRKLRTLLTQEEGAALIEYALLVALIAIGVLIGVSQMGQALSKTFRNAANTLNAIPTQP